MRIGAIEMEKARRNKERESAMGRVEGIDTRIQEIEAEKAKLLQILDKQSPNNPICTRNFEPKSTPRQSTGGFKLRY